MLAPPDSASPPLSNRCFRRSYRSSKDIPMHGSRLRLAAAAAAFAALVLSAGPAAVAQEFRTSASDPAQPGLLFYLSGEHGFTADVAANGKADPNFLKDVKELPGGEKGNYLQCGND